MRFNSENFIDAIRAVAHTIDAPCTVHVHEMEIDNRRVYAYQIVLNGNSCGPIMDLNETRCALWGIRMGIKAVDLESMEVEE